MSDKKEFSIIIANNYNKIQRNFKIGLYNHGYEYNEDIFTDTFIKCYSTLKNRQMEEKEAIRYLWVAYVNKLKNNIKKHKEEIGIPLNYDCCDEEYNYDIDSIYNIIIQKISEEFGSDVAQAWKKYTCKENTYNELKDCGMIGNNFMYILKKIKKYIRNVLIHNPEFKEIISNIRTT